METVFVCGSFEDEYDFNFRQAKASLKAADYYPISPLEIFKMNEGLYRDNEDEMLRQSIGLLLRCQKIHLIKGWEKSPRAMFEKAVADRLGMPAVKVKLLTPYWDGKD